MATKKDLVEAYAFSRRRLVTAFLSGAPGGREVEPARPGRTVVGGLALAVLLVAGAAIASVLASRTEEDWNKVGLVVSKQDAAPYVILKEAKHPTLIPVINITSAQLILGADVQATYVDQSVVQDQTPGEPIGIYGAPQTLPRPEQFIEQGWTSCTGQGLGMTLDISSTEHSRAEDGGGVLVSTSDGSSGTQYYVIAKSGSQDGQDRRAYAYPVPDLDVSDQALRDVGLQARANAISVPQAWVRLFPVGGPLSADSFDIADWGKPPPAAIARSLPAGAKVGQYYEDGSQSGVVTDQGSVQLDAFSLAVYKQTLWGKGKRQQVPSPLSAAPDATLRGAADILADAHWPDSVLKSVTGQVCAQLDLGAGAAPKVALRGDPTSTAEAAEDSTTTSNVAFSIDRGHGAYVMSGDWNDDSSSTRVVIDPRGLVYPLSGTDTVTKLGYDAVSPPVVPDTWIKLMSPGVTLSTNAALCPPVPAATPVDIGASPSASASASPGVAAGGVPDCQVPPS